MKTLLTFFVLFFSSSVFGEWIMFAKDKKVSMYYENEKIKKSNNLFYVWHLMSFEEEQEVKNLSFYSVVTYIKIDCGINAFQKLTISLYSMKMSKGDKVHTQNNDDPELNYAEPGTFGDALHSEICS